MMKVFEATISNQVSSLFNDNLKEVSLFETANERLFELSGIVHFFSNQQEYDTLRQMVIEKIEIAEEPDRTEYGDFQTNKRLADAVVESLKLKNSNPTVVIEPTCGKGAFILAALNAFESIERIFGVETHKPYIWETKFNILEFYSNNPAGINKPRITLSHFNVFEFDFAQIAAEYSTDEILIIGNPPWVTNSKLSVLNSDNLPEKSNFKKLNGLDAITGKGNFDIGEYISLMMLDAFQNANGQFAFLVKNAVIKNILFDQKQARYKIADLQKHCIDSKKEFNVSVEAALFTCKLNLLPEFECREFDFYTSKYRSSFGWVDDKFVSDIEDYSHTQNIDGICPLEWRQGIKHDCSVIMELEKFNGKYVNGLTEAVTLEDDLVFGILKSSDLKQPVINETRKYTIVTQKKVGQETSYIQSKFPKTFAYLTKNKSYFSLRKSSIYKDKPMFSIFGIGDYSFKPYKVCISGLYKTYSFCLVLPQNNKPIMLDDTCYLLGFDKLEFAAYTQLLLNSEKAKNFLQSITFPDAKRTFTKEILMRIDLLKLALPLSRQMIEKDLEAINQNYNLNISSGSWGDYLSELSQVKSGQLNIFAEN